MKSTLIKDTTKSERIALVKQWEEEEGCENSGMNLMEYFRDYIDGKKEIAEVNAAFRTNYVVETPETEEKPMCGMGGRRYNYYSYQNDRNGKKMKSCRSGH